jgi:hypothetical protein
MAAIDFPSSPSENQLFTAATGLVYRYNSPVWNVVSGAVSAEQYNRIVNGSLLISQQNGLTDGTVNTLSMADQWGMYYTAAAGVFRGQRINTTTPAGGAYRMRVTINTANASPAAGDFLYLRQPIEGYRVADFGYGAAGAHQMVIRFGWKSPAGTYAVSVRNDAFDRSYVATFVISSGQANTDTLQTLVIPGDTSGTWQKENLGGLWLGWMLQSGTTYHTTANTWASGSFTGITGMQNNVNTSTAVFELFDIGVYRDPYKTGIAPQWQAIDSGAEHLQCSRYYWVSNYGNSRGAANVGSLVGHSLVANYVGLGNWRFTVPMRITPTITLWANGTQNQIRNISSGAYTAAGGVTGQASFTPQGGSNFSVTTVAASIWWDFDLQANARM